MGDGTRWLVMIRHLASWFILALSSTTLFVIPVLISTSLPWRLDTGLAYGDGLMSSDNDQMRRFLFVKRNMGRFWLEKLVR